MQRYSFFKKKANLEMKEIDVLTNFKYKTLFLFDLISCPPMIRKPLREARNVLKLKVLHMHI